MGVVDMPLTMFPRFANELKGREQSRHLVDMSNTALRAVAKS
jgi:hypothetical protein